MTNIYLTDSDKEAIARFVKDHEELYDKPMRSLKSRPGRIGCGKDSQAVATS